MTADSLPDEAERDGDLRDGDESGDDYFLAARIASWPSRSLRRSGYRC